MDPDKRISVERPPTVEAQIQALWTMINQISAEHKQVVEGLNKVVNTTNKLVERVQGVDSVAYAALMLHENKEFALTAENAKATHDKIGEVFAEMERYRAAREAQLKKKKSVVKSNPAPSGLLLPRQSRDKLYLPKGVERKRAEDKKVNKDARATDSTKR